MIRIYFLGKTIKSYLKRYGNERPPFQFTCTNNVPECKDRVLYKHGSYRRNGTTKYQQIKIPIYRWCCSKCGMTVSVFPDFLIPWARFVTPVRESVMKQRVRGKSYPRIAMAVASSAIAVSDITIKRWWKRYIGQANDVTLWLAKQLIRLGESDDLLRLFSAGVNPTERDTVTWLKDLLDRYIHLHLSEPSVLQGKLSWLNARLPADYWI